MLKLLFPLLLIASSAFAQSFRVGVEGGIPLTNAFDTGIQTVAPTVVIGFPTYASYKSATKRYTVGVTAELGLPFHLAIKADALYKRVGFDSFIPVTPLLFGPTWNNTRANSFEFPVMAKYRLSKLGPLQPYIEGGVSFRTLEGATETLTTGCAECPQGAAPVTATPSPVYGLNHSFTKGITAGAGLELRHLPVGAFGEVRYTRWTAEAFSDPRGGLNSLRNQADLLVGVTF
jgi:hypothetical protein